MAVAGGAATAAATKEAAAVAATKEAATVATTKEATTKEAAAMAAAKGVATVAAAKYRMDHQDGSRWSQRLMRSQWRRSLVIVIFPADRPIHELFLLLTRLVSTK